MEFQELRVSAIADTPFREVLRRMKPPPIVPDFDFWRGDVKVDKIAGHLRNLSPTKIIYLLNAIIAIFGMSSLSNLDRNAAWWLATLMAVVSATLHAYMVYLDHGKDTRKPDDEAESHLVKEGEGENRKVA